MPTQHNDVELTAEKSGAATAQLQLAFSLLLGMRAMRSHTGVQSDSVTFFSLFLGLSTHLWHMQESMKEQLALSSQQQQLDSYRAATSSNVVSHAAGLHNQTGEYNCFLNVIVQCLWSLEGFCEQIMEWPRAVYQVG